MTLRRRTIKLGYDSTITIEEGKPYEARAWPGLYPIVYYTNDGETLCAECATAQEERDADTEPHLLRQFPGMSVMGCDVLEGSAIDHGIVECSECNKVIVDIDREWEWQCECGTVNDNDTTVCQCGHARNGE